jgi:GntR family transcriptional regulator, transcriptional repressor for pyruvate dehydrogenase complex
MTAYQRVITHVTSKIESGKWGPGFKLPSASELAEELDVGMTTVVNALRSLQDRGKIIGRAGSGRFVPGGDTNAQPTSNDAA